MWEQKGLSLFHVHAELPKDEGQGGVESLSRKLLHLGIQGKGQELPRVRKQGGTKEGQLEWVIGE